MSLRARLIATLVAVAAAGLIVLAVVTYASQRSFLYDRVDDQTRSGEAAVRRALEDQGVITRMGPGRGPGGFGPHGGGRAGGPGGPGTDRALPPGTYGQARDTSGEVVGSVVLTYGETTPPAPKLPAKLDAGDVLTLDAVSGDTRYRVRAHPGPSGTTIVAVPLTEVDDTLGRLVVVEGVVIVAVLLLLGGAAYFLVRAELRPLERIGATADAIAAGDLSRRVDADNPRTEVGRLGLALNAMLERLEKAFVARAASERRLREFLADASHELRTPLASIRGYAEVFRIGAAASPEEVDKSMRRIEEEAARMGVLVEDLLALARLDEVRETVKEDVDLAQLAQDAAADARAVDAERPIEARSDGDALVQGDPHQLRQVLANLLRNALVHTPAGTPIEVTTRASNGRVELEVRDHGAGLPPGDPQALFQRFWRAEGGRERGKAGAGLGLAIVAGIVDAHQGEVRAADAPGGGAAFTVTLPAAAQSR